MKRILCCTIFLAAATAYAEAHPRHVEVDLSGPGGCQNIPKIIQVVVNGDEQKSFTLEHSNGCLWSGDSHEPLDRDDLFSLRVGGGRTPVHRIAGFKNNRSVARLHFEPPAGNASNIEVDARDTDNGWVNLGYVRHVLAGGADEVEVDERGRLTATSVHRIFDVNFDAEKLRLLLPAMRSDAPGLLVNPLLMKTKRLSLDGVHLVDALTKQAGSGSAPNNAAAARLPFENLVRDSHFGRLELKKQ